MRQILAKISLLALLGICECRFILPESNTLDILTSPFNYPNHTEELDIIWRYTHSIHLDIHSFELDGQNGDFLLISELPLTFEESFVEYNNSGGLPEGLLGQSIVTSQGILLSWNVSTSTNIQILSEHGTFIYFHAELTQGRGTFPFKGFNITVDDLDEMRTPPPRTTTEGTTNRPESGEEIYVSKFLSCMRPREFLEQKNKFKEDIAQIATEYCRETAGCGEFLTTDLNISDINIPTDGGLRFCDPAWDVFDSCVEVTFAITRFEQKYLMPKSHIDDMWDKKQQQLTEKNYCPYIPPVSLANIKTWVWMASILGILFFLLLPVCLLWARNEQDHHYPSDVDTSKEIENEDAAPADKRFFDRNNPIYNVIAKIKKGNDESKYLEMTHGQSSDSTATMTESTVYKPKTTTNLLFQEQEVTFQHDNKGFEDNEEYGFSFNSSRRGNDDEVVLYGRTDLTYPTNSNGRRYPEGEDSFLRIQRGEYEGNSDTEI